METPRLIPSVIACVLCLPPVLSADNYPRQPEIDIQNYIFRVTLSDATDAMEGEATVDVRFVRDGVRSFALDLASAVNGRGMTVASVSSGGQPADFSHSGGRLAIRLAAAPAAGERRQFTVRYGGVPAGGLKALDNRYGQRTFFSANWPDLARQWLPVVDHPYDKAACEFIVTAPARYQVVANGRLVEELDLGDGRRRTHWKEAVPIATWLANIGVAQFNSRHFGEAMGVPLQTWVFRQDTGKGIAWFEQATRDAVEFFTRRIGPYPYEKLADVEAAGFEGGMEHASAVFYDQRLLAEQPMAGVVAHEIAHQWFGDSVTENDWDDVWLSEGFATYLEMAAAESLRGRDAFTASLRRSRATIYALEKKTPGVAVIQAGPWEGIPNGIVYQKGGWTLHMLRGLVGEERFWGGIREYFRRFRDGNASTEDFRRVMEEVSGVELGWFFRQWLYRPGSPAVEGSWRYDGAGKRASVELVQTQAGEPYRLALEIGVMAGGSAPARVVRVEMSERRQRFEIPLDRKPVALALDPDTRILVAAQPLLIER